MTPDLQQLGIEQLSSGERIELIGLIWDSLDDTQIDPTPPHWHVEELERRIAAADANPNAGSQWEEVRANLLGER